MEEDSVVRIQRGQKDVRSLTPSPNLTAVTELQVRKRPRENRQRALKPRRNKTDHPQLAAAVGANT